MCLKNLRIKSAKSGYIYSIDGCFLGTNAYLTKNAGRSLTQFHTECEKLKSEVLKLAKKSKKQIIFIIGQRFGLYSNITSPASEDFYRISTKNYESFDLESSRKLFKSSINNFVNQLTVYGHKVIILGQVPNLGKSGPNMACISKAFRKKKNYLCGQLKEYWDQYYEFARDVLNNLESKRVIVYQPDEILCRSESKRCSTILSDILLYADDNHLNDLGAKFLYENSKLPKLQ